MYRFTNEQIRSSDIKICCHSNVKGSKIPYFWPFDDNYSNCPVKVFLFHIFLFNRYNRQFFKQFFERLYVRLRATLFYHIVKVALNPAYKFFLNFVKTFVLLIRQSCIKTKNFHQVVLELLPSKGKN